MTPRELDIAKIIAVTFCVVLILLPLVHCEIQTQKADADIKKECIKAKGNWGRHSWGTPSCQFVLKPD